MSDSWLTKYEPLTTSEIIVNKNKVQSIKKALSANIIKSPNIIISGEHGIGKNLAAKLILKELNFVNNDTILQLLKKKCSVQEIIENHHAYDSMKKLVDNDDRRSAIIINDVESINLKTEKKNLIAFCKYNSKYKLLPMIFIIDQQHNKYVNEFRKICTEYAFNIPTFDDMLTITRQITTKENIIFSEQKIENSIIKYAQSDIRRLINILQDIKITYPDGPFNIELYHKYINHTNKKDIEMKLFEATDLLLNEKVPIQKCFELYTEEKVLLPLMLYENHTKNIFSKVDLNKDKEQNLDKILDVSRTLGDFASKADVVETNIYTDQSWINQTIYGFYTLCMGSYILNFNLPKQKTKHDISFNADLNKTSLRKINKKINITPIQLASGFDKINDILHMNKLLHYLQERDNYRSLSYCSTFKKVEQKKKKKSTQKSTDNNTPSKYVELILKLDKTNI